MGGYINVPAAIAEAKRILEKKADVMEEVNIVRTDLRNAAKMGNGTADELAWIEETFPVHERKQHSRKRPVAAK